MEVREIGSQERERYNEFVWNSEKNHFLQSFEWGDLKAETEWTPIRIAAEQDGKMVGAIQLLKRSLPLKGKSILYAPRGPILDYRDKEVFGALFHFTKKVAKKNGAIFLKIDPDIPDDDIDVKKMLSNFGFVRNERGKNFEGVQPRFVFRLPLNHDLDELLASFESKTRYNIRLAKRKGVEVVDDVTKEHLPIFYEILKVTAKRDNYMIRSYSYYESIWKHFMEKGLAKLFMAKYKDEYIAGTLAFLFGDKAWYLYGASSNQHRNVMPNYALQWEMIKWAYENDCSIYDFRGVSGDLDPNNPLYGLYRFKKGFNGDFIEFIGEYDYKYSPLWYSLWNNIEPKYRRIRQSLRRSNSKTENTGGSSE